MRPSEKRSGRTEYKGGALGDEATASLLSATDRLTSHPEAVAPTWGKEKTMGIPSSWPLAYKRAVLVTASLIVLTAYLTTCLALTQLSVLFVH